jgi:hypothetical protein
VGPVAPGSSWCLPGAVGPASPSGISNPGLTPGLAPSADVLDVATDLRMISRNGTGVDAVDLAAARRAGIRVERAVGERQGWPS